MRSGRAMPGSRSAAGATGCQNFRRRRPIAVVEPVLVNCCRRSMRRDRSSDSICSPRCMRRAFSGGGGRAWGEASAMAEYDVLIRGGTIVDGSGGEPFRGDVAISDRTIAAVGRVEGTAGEEIDARGRIVT